MGDYHIDATLYHPPSSSKTNHPFAASNSAATTTTEPINTHLLRPGAAGTGPAQYDGRASPTSPVRPYPSPTASLHNPFGGSSSSGDRRQNTSTSTISSTFPPSTSSSSSYQQQQQQQQAQAQAHQHYAQQQQQQLNDAARNASNPAYPTFDSSNLNPPPPSYNAVSVGCGPVDGNGNTRPSEDLCPYPRSREAGLTMYCRRITCTVPPSLPSHIQLDSMSSYSNSNNPRSYYNDGGQQQQQQAQQQQQQQQQAQHQHQHQHQQQKQYFQQMQQHSNSSDPTNDFSLMSAGPPSPDKMDMLPHGSSQPYHPSHHHHNYGNNSNNNQQKAKRES